MGRGKLPKPACGYTYTHTHKLVHSRATHGHSRIQKLQSVSLHVTCTTSLYMESWLFACEDFQARFPFPGMGAPLAGVAPIFALSFMGFGIGKKIQQTSPDQVDISQTYSFFYTVASIPFHEAKCRVLDQGTIKHGMVLMVTPLKQKLLNYKISRQYLWLCHTLLHTISTKRSVYYTVPR